MWSLSPLGVLVRILRALRHLAGVLEEPPGPCHDRAGDGCHRPDDGPLPGVGDVEVPDVGEDVHDARPDESSTRQGDGLSQCQ